jgi:signal peptidase II
MKLYGFSIFVVLIAIDQLSKYLIRHSSGFYICNPNISWNISISSTTFWTIWGAITFFLTLLWLDSLEIFNFQFSIFNKFSSFKLKIFNIALTLILSGAISNIIDRLQLGCVIDFIDLKFWPIFNLADVFIVLGAILLLAKWGKI